ncbi:hypothetical protein HGA89_03270, partial [bacterium]|nr:hypothetical protein [bacterium]
MMLPDLHAAFPAASARTLGLGSVPLLCAQEMDVEGALPRVVRVLDRTVRYVGDGVALVAATSEEVAEAALALLKVEYEVLPAVLTMD